MTEDNVRYLAGSALPAREDRDWITSAELVQDSGITYRQLDYWTRTNLLHPLEQHTPGSGHLRRFDTEQLRRAQALRDLIHAGVSLVTCREVIDEITEAGHVTVGAVTITHHTPGDAA